MTAPSLARALGTFIAARFPDYVLREPVVDPDVDQLARDLAGEWKCDALTRKEDYDRFRKQRGDDE